MLSTPRHSLEDPKHRCQLVLPCLAVPFPQIFRYQPRRIRRNTPNITLACEEVCQVFLRKPLAVAAQSVPEIIQIARTWPLLLLLEKRPHFLGHNFNLSVRIHGERTDVRIGRLYCPTLRRNQDRLIKREMHFDRWQGLSARPASNCSRAISTWASFSRSWGSLTLIRMPQSFSTLFATSRSIPCAFVMFDVVGLHEKSISSENR